MLTWKIVFCISLWTLVPAAPLESMQSLQADGNLYKIAYSCEHSELQVSCTEGSVIHIIRAKYGRSTRNLCNDDGQVVWAGEPCMSDASNMITIDRCEQKRSCSVLASNTIFGDPCPGTIKYLEVDYACVPRSSLHSTVYSCEDNDLRFGCIEGSAIHIIRAKYGRSTRNLCNIDGKVVWSGRSCLSDGSNRKIIDRCEQKRTCSVPASNAIFGDPCPGTIKYLEVDYTCVPPGGSLHKTVYSCENNELHISCFESGVIHIIEANYGRSTRDLCNTDSKVAWSGALCTSDRSNRIMIDRCEQKQSCSVSASNTIFGDPCFGTIKYLEVEYACVPPMNFVSDINKPTTFLNSSIHEQDTLPDTTLDSNLYKSLYSCEHNELHVDCLESHAIHIMRANYGRLVNNLCNDDGKVKWSGKTCMSGMSYQIMIERCEKQQSCTVPASNAVFGDPCHGTIKYLEIQYVCISSITENSTTFTSSSAPDLDSKYDTTLGTMFETLGDIDSTIPVILLPTDSSSVSESSFPEKDVQSVLINTPPPSSTTERPTMFTSSAPSDFDSKSGNEFWAVLDSLDDLDATIPVTSLSTDSSIVSETSPDRNFQSALTNSPPISNVLLKRYFNLMNYCRELRKKNEIKCKYANSGCFASDWTNFHRLFCQNDNLADDESIKNTIKSPFKNPDISNAPPVLAIIVGAEGSQILDLDTMIEENEIRKDEGVAAIDMQISPLIFNLRKRMETTNLLIKKKEYGFSEDTFKQAMHFLRNLKNTEIDDADEAYGHYIIKSLSSIANPKEREMARIALQNVLVQYRFKEDAE